MKEDITISTVKKAIITFVILTFAFSSIFYYLIITTGMGGYKTFLLMWMPALSAIITSLIFFRTIRGFGWRPGKIRYWIIAYTLPIITSIIIYGIFWLSGLGTYTGDLPGNIIFAIGLGTVNNIISALGEEIGWRGFLVPQLAKLTTYGWISLISGIIWALWHFPVIIFSTYVGGTPLWWSLPLFFMGVITFSFIIAWLTLKSGSLWPAVILHASDNLFTQEIFAPLGGGDLSPYLVGESGIITLIVMVVVALIFWMFRDRLPDLRINKSR
ncbi:MAG: CPBP family intramembrane glutamic endopeptidase [Methanomicrobiales archaeon]